MAKKTILTVLYAIASLPFLLISTILAKYNIWGLKDDITLCIDVIERNKNIKLCNNLLDILIIAEDKRNNFHCGVDQIALVRALYVRIKFGFVQGASTIEQQFVRVVTQRYERKLSRKLREQILATAVLRKSSKTDIATSYLSIAFYGSNLYGKTGLEKLCTKPLSQVGLPIAIEIISRLKYPEPVKRNMKWREKIFYRNQYILKEISKSGNKSFKTDSLKLAV